MNSNARSFHLPNAKAVQQLAERTRQTLLRVEEMRAKQAIIKQHLQEIDQRCDALQAKLAEART